MGGFVRLGYPGSDLKASHSLTHHTHSMEHTRQSPLRAHRNFAGPAGLGSVGQSQLPQAASPRYLTSVAEAGIAFSPNPHTERESPLRAHRNFAGVAESALPKASNLSIATRERGANDIEVS